MFGMNDVLEREVARLTKYTILAFIIREDVLAQRFRNLDSFLRMVCAMGCVVAAFIAIEVFTALLVPVYYLNLLIHRWYRPSEGAADVTQHPVPAVEESDLSTLSKEVPSHSSSSHSTTSEGIRRLGLFINAYLDEAASAASVIELDDQFEYTPSMHALPPVQTTPPPTPPFSLPAAPIPGTPALSHVSPVVTTLSSGPSPKVTFELAKEDEEIADLAARLSNFHIEFEACSAPRRSKRPSQRSTILFEAYERSLDPPLAMSPCEGWMAEWLKPGCVAGVGMRK
ncbi:hypothetical protein RhiJN_24260 [Ceratobasidium sp. AG-Ba]|nr:hypothetical protein RhiJN_24260 [Ceratobasidium sp. AG-Ba]